MRPERLIVIEFFDPDGQKLILIALVFIHAAQLQGSDFATVQILEQTAV